MPKRPLHILLVEDDAVDAEFMLRSFQKGNRQWSITHARDGLEALDILRGRADGGRPMPPYIILTDINMPRMNGLEFLRELRGDAHLRQSVVFVLTGSALTTDKLAAYDQQIAGYILKATVTTDFSLLVSLLQCYQEHVELPL